MIASKKIGYLLVVAVFSSACGHDPKPGEFVKVESAQPAVDSTATAMEKIKARAIAEDDYVGRVRSSLTVLQEEYTNAKGKIKGIGDVSVKVDELFNLLIENKEGGHVYTTQVNLKNLNPEQGGLQLIPDLTEAEDPGLKIMVLDGKPGVVYSIDGAKQREDKWLEIRLPERKNIERLTPAMVQALYVVHGKIE